MMWLTLHHTSHFTTEMLAKDCSGVHVVSRTLVHGAGTTCSSICADTFNGAWFFYCQMHTARQEQAVSKPAYSWLSDNMNVSSLSVGSMFQWFVLHYREFEQQCIQQSLEDAACPHFCFQVHIAYRCCCRCLTMVSSLTALAWCLNYQLMIRSHRQDLRTFFSCHESRRVVISCSAKL